MRNFFSIALTVVGERIATDTFRNSIDYFFLKQTNQEFRAHFGNTIMSEKRPNRVLLPELRTLSDCISAERKIRRHFHTCPNLLEKKKQLEDLVRECRTNVVLRRHFKTNFRKRKVDFYRKIIYEIVTGTSELETRICELTKDILFIYSEKQGALESLDWVANDMEAHMEDAESQREFMIEYFRGCD